LIPVISPLPFPEIADAALLIRVEPNASSGGGISRKTDLQLPRAELDNDYLIVGA
jgi:hypothetical protein